MNDRFMHPVIDRNNPTLQFIVGNFSKEEYSKYIDMGMDVFNELKGNGIHIYGGFCPRHYGFLKQVCKTDCNTCHMNAIKEMKPYFKHRSRYV